MLVAPFSYDRIATEPVPLLMGELLLLEHEAMPTRADIERFFKRGSRLR
ncbi:MAG: hypothetical protein GWP91_01180 [Rhodobacterales bacterium]|nr:hypothetical protein [Rhodobacterales bacterium]